MPEETQQVYLAGEVALWLQRFCGAPLEFLGCHNVTGVSVPRGDTNPLYCRVDKNKFKVIRTWRGVAGLGSMTLVVRAQVLNLITEIPCPYNIYTLVSACGADEDPTNWDYLYLFYTVEPTSEDIDSLSVGISPDDQTEINLSVPASFTERLKVKRIVAADLSIDTLLDFNSIVFCDPVECSDLCGDQSYGCQVGYIATDAELAVLATIYKTIDGGATWTDLNSPFTDAAQDITRVRCDGDTVIALNGTDSRYAFSWDGGASWTEVITPTEIINNLFVLGATKIWFCGQNGAIYFSDDRGNSIETQGAGATTQSLNAIAFANALRGYAIGDNNAFVRTVDGGDTWTAVVGPAVGIFPNDLYSLAVVPDTSTVIVGDEQGNLYRSTDAGDTWTTIFTATAATAGGIPAIALCDCNVWAFIANDEDPYFYSGVGVDGVMFQTIDGGATWMQIDVPVNDGLNDVTCCDINTYWIVGENGFVAKVAGPGI